MEKKISNQIKVLNHLFKKNEVLIDILTNSTEVEFCVYNGEKEIDYLKKVTSNKQVQLQIPLTKEMIDIKIVARIEDEEITLLMIHMNALLKCKMKIISMVIKICLFNEIMIRGVKFLWREHRFIIPFSVYKKYFNQFSTRVKQGGEVLLNPYIISDYEKWIHETEKRSEVMSLKMNPLFSIITPVYNADKIVLIECIESVLKQSYENFELILVDDASTKKETLDTLKHYENLDVRIKIKYRTVNGHISRASNEGIELARGEFIALLDNDDVLCENALYENALVINSHPNLDMIYSDEDKLNLQGKRCDPHFKPDFSFDTLLGINYICHFTVLRTSLVKQVGGFRIGYEGAQDHDLFLRIVENTNKIHHIAKILYHWRMVEGSTSLEIGNKSYAIVNGEKVIEDAILRRNTKATFENVLSSTVYYVDYDALETSVSIIIPLRDFAGITETCVNSIIEKTLYKNYEILLVDNNSVEEKTFDFFKKIQNKQANVRVITADMEFNYSAINNLAVSQASGEVLMFLNNDTEIIDGNWLSNMVGYAIQKHVGAIGAKLLYPDLTIQHAGVFVGLGGGVGCHAFLEKDRMDNGVFGRLAIPYNYSAVTAACMAIKKALFIEVGGFDESLKVAYNDIDLCLKLLDKNYFNVVLPKVELIHHESKSRGVDTESDKYKRFLAESEYMYARWDDYLDRDPYYNLNYSKKGLFMFDKIKK